MARTYHHDRKRFHPWENPKASHRKMLKFVACHPWRTSFYYIDYSTAGPRWWRNMQMERPARRAAKLIETRHRNVSLWSVPVPCCTPPCDQCFEDYFEFFFSQFDDLGEWVQPDKSVIYYW